MTTKLKAFLIGCMIAGAIWQVQAASYTITVTTGPRQETALAAIVAKINADRAAETPAKPPITNQDYLQNILNGALASYRQQYEDTEGQQVKDALPTATDAQLAQIKTILGLK